MTGLSQADKKPKAPAAPPPVSKDEAEYDAYANALNTVDPAQKAEALEAFLRQYPNSDIKLDALEEAMTAYQQAGNQAKLEATANQILSVDPNRVRALAVAVYFARAKDDAPSAARACDLAKTGLQALPKWKKRPNMSDQDFATLRKQMQAIFDGACGFAALQVKDYATARDYYVQSLTIDSTNMADTYQLAIAELAMKPLDIHAFWYLAKAVNLAHGNDKAVQTVSSYGVSAYTKYHGSDEGWKQLVDAAATQPAPPANFTVADAGAGLAVKAVQENDPATLSFGDWEYVLGYRDASPANKDAADKVWAAIVSKQDQSKENWRLPVKVISATSDTIQAALTDDNQKANQADLEVHLQKPLSSPPAAGALIDVEGRITDYTPKPFTFIIKDGELPPAKAPAHPKRARHKPGE